MKHFIYKLFSGMLLLGLIVSCADKWEIVKDNRPDIPVTFVGATTNGFNPYYTVLYAADSFFITLSIRVMPNIKSRK